MEFKILLIIVISALISGSFSQEVLMHDLTLINRVRDIDIVSLYLWGSGTGSKGENRLGNPMLPDSSITVSIPSGSCNILAFDELGNSYGIKGNLQKNIPDTIEIDLGLLTFITPNVDMGQYPLNLTNELNGFALEKIVLTSDRFDAEILIDEYRIFSDNNIIVWLNKGNYSIDVIDELDRTFNHEEIWIPGENSMIHIYDSMISSPVESPPIIGSGSRRLSVENCLSRTSIRELRILPAENFQGLYLDDIDLQPGASIILALDHGEYILRALDDRNGMYTLFIEVSDSSELSLPILSEYLDFNFSFPRITE